jgi:hypothetical protein
MIRQVIADRQSKKRAEPCPALDGIPSLKSGVKNQNSIVSSGSVFRQN